MSWQEIYKWYSGTHGAPVSGEASGVKMGKDHQEGTGQLLGLRHHQAPCKRLLSYSVKENFGVPSKDVYTLKPPDAPGMRLRRRYRLVLRENHAAYEEGYGSLCTGGASIESRPSEQRWPLEHRDVGEFSDHYTV